MSRLRGWWGRARMLWAFDARHLGGHRTRVSLSVLGIAAGVALAVAVGALGSSIDDSLRGRARAAASEANLEVRPTADVGLPIGILEEVRAVDGVEAVGSTVESHTLLRQGETEVRTFLIGVDQGALEMAPEALEESAVDPVDALGLFVSPGVARELDVGAGDVLRAAAGDRWTRVAVGGVLPASSRDARIAVGALGVVQDLVGVEGRVDAIYVRATDPEAVGSRLEAAVGDRARIGPPGLLGAEVRQLVGSITMALTVTAAVALFVGSFLVYNTMGMAAAERLSEGGLLRAIGASRGQVFRLFAAEGGLLGILGAGVGVGGGVLLARVLLATRGAGLGEIFPIEVTSFSVEAFDLAVPAGAGVVAALLATILPARAVSRADPVLALRRGAPDRNDRGAARRYVVAGSGLAAVGVLGGVAGVLLGDGGRTIPLVAFVVLLFGLVLALRGIVPGLVRVLLGGAGQLGSRLPRVARFAAGAIQRSPGRTTFTAGAVVLALSLVIAFTIALGSFTTSIRTWFDDNMTGELYVRAATWAPFGADVPLSDSLRDELEALPSVTEASRFRSVVASLDGRAALFQGSDDPWAVQPDSSAGGDPVARLQRSGTVLASPSALQTFGLEVGDTFDVATAAGPRMLRIVGTDVEPEALIPQFNSGFETFEATWGVGGADSFDIFLRSGVDREDARAEILTQFPDAAIRVDTGAEFQEEALGLLDGIGDLMSSVTVVAVGIAALGVANTLVISVLERRRELGVLRAVGMLRRQVVGMVTTEALAVGVLGVILGWGVGTGLGYLMSLYIADGSGLPMPMVYPLGVYVGTAVLGLVATAGAALVPARRAARREVSTALQYE